MGPSAELGQPSQWKRKCMRAQHPRRHVCLRLRLPKVELSGTAIAEQEIVWEVPLSWLSPLLSEACRHRNSRSKSIRTI